MKRAVTTALVALLASTFALAQAAPASGAPAAKPGQQAAPQQPPAQPAAPAGKRQPMAKTQAEFTDFQAAANQQDIAAAENAAAEFVEKYPDSELRASVYQMMMNRYQQSNNSAKTVEMGRKSLQFDPDNALSLVVVATAVVERVRSTDLDKDEKLAEVGRDANHALQTVKDVLLPANLTPAQAQQARNTLTSMAYSAIGTAAIVQENYAEAEQNLRKSVELPGIDPDPLSWLRFSIALDHINKYAEALQAANKTIEISQQPQWAAVSNLAKQERDRLTKLAAPAQGAATPTPDKPPSSPPNPKF